MNNTDKIIVSIKDTRAETFDNPILQPNAATAIRGLQNLFKDEKASDNQFIQTPEDFELHCLGTFDPYTGEITPRKEDTLIIKLTSVAESTIKPITD